ncbi:hypothetical protein EVAR_11229_1 [Eumeta japonica]|uniref:Uncharacterized protein n=1 Tax=Eumeta variegata TaxID=151549 RepID=A0A4C1ULZ7_EUMVA|nr:hypothetical protein EVAR_11229_1 [Eumeta japonica]
MVVRDITLDLRVTSPHYGIYSSPRSVNAFSVTSRPAPPVRLSVSPLTLPMLITEVQGALLELKASKETCDCLISERDAHETETRSVIFMNSKLKGELAEMYVKYNYLTDQSDPLQVPSNLSYGESRVGRVVTVGGPPTATMVKLRSSISLKFYYEILLHALTQGTCVYRRALCPPVCVTDLAVHTLSVLYSGDLCCLTLIYGVYTCARAGFCVQNTDAIIAVMEPRSIVRADRQYRTVLYTGLCLVVGVFNQLTPKPRAPQSFYFTLMGLIVTFHDQWRSTTVVTVGVAGVRADGVVCPPGHGATDLI